MKAYKIYAGYDGAEISYAFTFNKDKIPEIILRLEKEEIDYHNNMRVKYKNDIDYKNIEYYQLPPTIFYWDEIEIED